MADDLAAGDALALEIGAGETELRVKGGWGRWLALRLGAGLLVLLAISLIVFLSTQILPGDAAQAILGRSATSEQIAKVRAELHLDDSLPSQYWHWISGVLHGDLGNSLSQSRPVTDVVGEPVLNSIELLLITALISIPLAVFLGVVMAVRRDSILDRTGLLVSFVITALPEFVIGLLLVMVFATTLFTVLPAVAIIPPGESAISHPEEIILPVATLVLAVTPYLYRLVRAAMLDVLESEYVKTAELNGLTQRTILWRHALPNALVPTIQASALVLTYLLGGLVVVEYLFNFPGVGTALINAVSARDVPVVQVIVLFIAAAVVIFNMIADVLTVLASPRTRTANR